jgi:hypothetical protein
MPRNYGGNGIPAVAERAVASVDTPLLVSKDRPINPSNIVQIPEIEILHLPHESWNSWGCSDSHTSFFESGEDIFRGRGSAGIVRIGPGQG